MFWSRKRQAEPGTVPGDWERMQAEVGRIGSELRQLQGEQALLHDQVYKWMKRAVAAERATRNQDPPERTPAENSLAGDSAVQLIGARARIARRRARAAAETNGGDNGVHPSLRAAPG